jgi:hypothetical protein
MVEEWKGGKWVPGGAGYGEVIGAPPVSAEFAVRLGIPIEDLQEATDRTGASEKLHLVMIDPPGPSSALEEWKRYLTELEALPLNALNRNQLIDETKRTIARKRQKVERPSELLSTDTNLLSANRNKKVVGFRPDYGLRLSKDGFSRTADLFFMSFVFIPFPSSKMVTTRPWLNNATKEKCTPYHSILITPSLSKFLSEPIRLSPPLYKPNCRKNYSPGP